MKASLNNGWKVEGTPEEIFELQSLFWKQERLDQVTEDIGEKLAKESKLTRAEVVARAMRDVDVLIDRMVDKNMDINEGNYVFRHLRTVPEFIVNREKRTVVALVRSMSSEVIYEKGIAKCAPDDVFNADIGKAIALRRALGLDVPDEYLNAPKPEGVAVGDVVQYYLNGKESFTHVVQDNRDIDTINRDNRMAIFWTAKVIDDTDREEYRSVGV